MSQGQSETLQRGLNDLLREILADQNVSEEEANRIRVRLEELAAQAAAEGTGNLIDTIGLNPEGPKTFEDIPEVALKPDFDDSVVSSQVRAAADLYWIYQYERMRAFDVVDVLLRLFHNGQMRLQSGPGARSLYLLERHRPLRYSRDERMLAYRRTFNYGARQAPSGAVVNGNFHRQFVAFTASIAQYYRDLLIGQVIRGSNTLDQRPFGSQATIQRVGADLRYQLDRATYGNTFALVKETKQYLASILAALEAPDILKAFDANNKWDVIETVARRHLNANPELSARSKMADTGQRLLTYVADSRFDVRDFKAFQNEISAFGAISEEWIAAYRMTSDGRNFRGVADTMRDILGTNRTRAA
jgi:hypothetical protein